MPHAVSNQNSANRGVSSYNFRKLQSSGATKAQDSEGDVFAIGSLETPFSTACVERNIPGLLQQPGCTLFCNDVLPGIDSRRGRRL